MFNCYGGKNSWAIVTGGSDGIGLEICDQMAEQGFNIFIIGRSQTKILEKLQDIKIKHNVHTKSILFDFAELCTIKDYQTKIAEKVKDIDIGMLFLNAGCGHGGAFAS